MLGGFQNGGDAHAASRADRNECAPRSFGRDKLAGLGEDPRAGCRKGMSERQAAAFDVHPGPVNRSQGVVQP